MKISSSVNIDIIIPCLNEGRHLQQTLNTLTKLTEKSNINIKIIISDNGSVDNSHIIAKSFGTCLLINKKVSVGTLRNYGANSSSGDILVFIDADIEVSPSWITKLSNMTDLTSSNDLIVTGYRVQCPADGNKLQKCWYGGILPMPNYINSGNLITTRKLFTTLNGFSQHLTTGEDWDFCQRAKDIGATIIPDSNFLVYHHGFPDSIKSFFIREVWHGCGDFQSFANFIKSKPAILGTFTITITILWFSIVPFYHSLINFLSLPAFLSTIGILFARKRHGKMPCLPFNILLAILYVYARGVSLLVVLRKKIPYLKNSPYWRWR